MVADPFGVVAGVRVWVPQADHQGHGLWKRNTDPGGIEVLVLRRGIREAEVDGISGGENGG